MIEGASLIIAFSAGFLSFLSPCILPFIPPYISYLTGVSLRGVASSRQDVKKQRLKLLLVSLCFIFGFSLIFIILGTTASLIGQALAPQRILWQRIGGVIIIIFGSHLTGLFRISLLDKTKKFKLPDYFSKFKYLKAFLTGSIFAFGWTACVGPILASILVLASISATLGQGVLLLIIYSLGLAIPFILTGLFVGQASRYMRKFNKVAKYTAIFSGSLLIILGILFLFDEFSQLVSWLNGVYGDWGWSRI